MKEGIQSISNLIIALEKSDLLLSHKDPRSGLRIWPYIRVYVMISILEEKNNISNVRQQQFSSFFQRLKYFLFTARKNPWRIADGKEIIYFNSAVTNLKLGNIYFNRVTDYFYFCFPRSSVLIEDRHGSVLYTPRSHKHVYYQSSIQRLIKLRNKLFSDKRLDDKDVIKCFLIDLNKLLPDQMPDKFWRRIESKIASLLPVLSISYDTYKNFLIRKKPKIIFVEDGAYGSRYGLIPAAKDLGIKVAELQHGMVHKNHPAYNYGPAVQKDLSYTRYLPDYFLTYGKYWGAQINIPSRIVNVGNPYLIESLKVGIPESIVGKIVLLISSGVSVDEINEVGVILSRLCKERDYILKLRPAPNERSEAVSRYSEVILKGGQIDTGDLYKSLRQATIVVGEFSTVLFEAKAAYLPVYLFLSKFSRSWAMGNGLFEEVDLSNIHQIFQHQELGNERESDINYLWEQDWKRNFSKFLSEEVGI